MIPAIHRPDLRLELSIQSPAANAGRNAAAMRYRVMANGAMPQVVKTMAIPETVIDKATANLPRPTDSGLHRPPKLLETSNDAPAASAGNRLRRVSQTSVSTDDSSDQSPLRP